MLLAAAGILASGDRRQSLLLELGSGDAGGSHPRLASDLRITDYERPCLSAAFDPDADLVRFILDGAMDFRTTGFVPGDRDGPPPAPPRRAHTPVPAARPGLDLPRAAR